MCRCFMRSRNFSIDLSLVFFDHFSLRFDFCNFFLCSFGNFFRRRLGNVFDWRFNRRFFDCIDYRRLDRLCNCL